MWRRFIEGFADLVAIFQRLSYRELVKTALRKARGRLDQAPLLTDLARQLGQVLELASALRSALSEGKPEQYDANAESHCLGQVLLSAVFEAYLTIFQRKTAPFLRLASNGTGICPLGGLPADLVDVLVHTASALAGHFQSLHEFGLVSNKEAQALGCKAELPQVESVRSARRAGPDGQIAYDLVAEITQRVTVAPAPGKPGYTLVGGATVILGPKGDIRYLISKSAVACDRIRRRREFMESPQGRNFWRIDGSAYVEKASLYAAMHGPAAACQPAPAAARHT